MSPQIKQLLRNAFSAGISSSIWEDKKANRDAIKFSDNDAESIFQKFLRDEKKSITKLSFQ